MLDMNNKQQGISLYLLIMALLIVLSMTISISSLVIIRFGAVEGLGESIVAFYAADSGIEEQLHDLSDPSDSRPGKGTITGDITDQSSFVAKTTCRYGYTKCSILCPGEDGSNSCPSPVEGMPGYCSAPRFCIESRGSFGDTKRAIEVTY